MQNDNPHTPPDIEPPKPTTNEVPSPFITPLDVEQAPLGQYAVAPAPKKKKKWLVPVIIVVVIILAAAAAFAYYTLNKPKTTTPTPAVTTKTETKKVTALTASEIVAKTKAVATGDVKETITYSNGADPTPTFSAPLYKAPGYDFSVGAKAGSAAGFGSYGTQAIATTDQANIEKIFTDNSFTKTPIDTNGTEGVSIDTFETDTVLCQLTNDSPATSGTSQYDVVLGCADKSAYTDNAKALKPYFIAFAADPSNESTDVAMTLQNTKASKTTGYSISTVSINSSKPYAVGGFAGLFYTTPDGTVHFFKGTQSELACNAYSTTDLKKAYLGEQCYDEATENDQATVTL